MACSVGLGASNNPTVSSPRPATAGPESSADRDYERLLEADDLAQQEVDRWIRENEEFASKGAGMSQTEMNRRIFQRFEPVRTGYEDFINKHPNHVKARIAYGSFLGDIGDEDASRTQWEKALQLETNNPAIYNNLANIYSHSGPVKKGFEFYTKAIELNPREPTYYHNFGTVVYLFRSDAKEHYGINEDQVFAKAFGLYSNAMRLDPDNFPLASDVAQTYYGIKPMRTEEALKAWTNAFKIAKDDVERQGVHMHFARIKMMAGRFDEARGHLALATNAMYTTLSNRLARSLENRITDSTNRTAEPAGTASAAATAVQDRTQPGAK